MIAKLIFFIGLILSCSAMSQDLQLFSEQPIFINGDDGYECFRIPAIIKANNGDLLAFAEGRVHGCNDFGDVDIVMKRSLDNGVSWQKIIALVDEGEMQSGNPAPVVDKLDTRYKDGRLFLFYNNGIASEHQTRLGKGLRTVYFITSTDHGTTWSKPTDITTQVHKPYRPDLHKDYKFKEDWRSYANTPGHALQLQQGKKKRTAFLFQPTILQVHQ